MTLGSLETCRVMYFYLPTLAPMRPARSKRNRLLFIRGTADHARANKSKSTKGSCRRFARGRRGEEWPEEETFVRVNQPGGMVRASRTMDTLSEWGRGKEGIPPRNERLRGLFIPD